MRWVVSVKGVLLADGAVLLGLNDRGEWELPGGQLEETEQPRQAVAREFVEETGLEVHVGRLLLTETFEVVPGRTVLIVAYACRPRGGLRTTTSDEHSELRWVPVEDVGDIELPGVYRRAITAALEAGPMHPPADGS